MVVNFFSRNLFESLPPHERGVWEAMAKRLQVQEGRPFFTGEDGLPDEALDGFCRYLVDPQRPSPNTWKTYAYQVAVFLRWLIAQEKHWREVTREDLDMYYMVRTTDEFQMGPAILGQSWNIAKTALVHFYEYAHSKGLINNLPFGYRNQKAYFGGRVMRVPDISAKATKNHINFIAVQNYKASWRDQLGRRQNTQRNQALVDLLMSSGLRISEALNLKIHEIPDPDANDYKGLKSVTVSVTGKGKKRRKVRIPKRIVRAIRFYIEEERDEIDKGLSKRVSDEVFLSRTGSRLSERTVEDLFAAVSVASGFKLTPHGCRHTFAIYQLDSMIKKMAENLKEIREKGTDAYRQMLSDPLRELQKLLGHSHISTTYIYLDFLEESEALVDESLNDWTNWSNESER